jgi:hypothetical protein
MIDLVNWAFLALTVRLHARGAPCIREFVHPADSRFWHKTDTPKVFVIGSAIESKADMKCSARALLKVLARRAL